MEENKIDNYYNQQIDKMIWKKCQEKPKKLWSKFITKNNKKIIIYESSGKSDDKREKHWVIFIKPDDNGIFQDIHGADLANTWLIRVGKCVKKLLKQNYADIAYIYNNKKKKTKKRIKSSKKEYYFKNIKNIKCMENKFKLTLDEFMEIDEKTFTKMNKIEMFIDKKKDGKMIIWHFKTDEILLKLCIFKYIGWLFMIEAMKKKSLYHQKKGNYLISTIKGDNHFGRGVCINCGQWGNIFKCNSCKTGIRVCCKACFREIWCYHKLNCNWRCV